MTYFALGEKVVRDRLPVLLDRVGIESTAIHCEYMSLSGKLAIVVNWGGLRQFVDIHFHELDKFMSYNFLRGAERFLELRVQVIKDSFISDLVSEQNKLARDGGYYPNYLLDENLLYIDHCISQIFNKHEICYTDNRFDVELKKRSYKIKRITARIKWGDIACNLIWEAQLKKDSIANDYFKREADMLGEYKFKHFLVNRQNELAQKMAIKELA